MAARASPRLSMPARGTSRRCSISTDTTKPPPHSPTLGCVEPFKTFCGLNSQLCFGPRGDLDMLSILAAAVTAVVPAAAAPDGEAVEGVEITVTRPVTGTLEQGVQAYKPEFFTPVRPATAMDMIKWLPG